MDAAKAGHCRTGKKGMRAVLYHEWLATSKAGGAVLLQGEQCSLKSIRPCDLPITPHLAPSWRGVLSSH